jgi:hypothetical protein
MLGEALSEPGPVPRRGEEDGRVEWRRARWEGESGVPKRGAVDCCCGRAAAWVSGRAKGAFGAAWLVGEESDDVEDDRSRWAR